MCIIRYQLTASMLEENGTEFLMCSSLTARLSSEPIYYCEKKKNLSRLFCMSKELTNWHCSLHQLRNYIRCSVRALASMLVCTVGQRLSYSCRYFWTLWLTGLAYGTILAKMGSVHHVFHWVCQLYTSGGCGWRCSHHYPMEQKRL